MGPEKNILVIAVVNPVALGLIKPPGLWGSDGADIVVGEGQPLGVPLSSGGPYFGFMCCKQMHLRQMPGRLVGRTMDADGKRGFVLTLQAREQHIRRSKATSNICTNQGLMVTAATIHMALLGQGGLQRVAAQCWSNAHILAEKLAGVPGLRLLFGGDFFHEFALSLDRPCGPVLEHLAERGILAGYSLEKDYPELGPAMLVCATETKTGEDLDRYVQELAAVLA